MLDLLLAHHRPETAADFSSITSFKFFLNFVFAFKPGNTSILPELFFLFLNIRPFLPLKKQVSFDLSVCL